MARRKQRPPESPTLARTSLPFVLGASFLEATAGVAVFPAKARLTPLVCPSDTVRSAASGAREVLRWRLQPQLVKASLERVEVDGSAKKCVVEDRNRGVEAPVRVEGGKGLAVAAVGRWDGSAAAEPRVSTPCPCRDTSEPSNNHAR